RESFAAGPREAAARGGRLKSPRDRWLPARNARRGRFSGGWNTLGPLAGLGFRDARSWASAANVAEGEAYFAESKPQYRVTDRWDGAKFNERFAFFAGLTAASSFALRTPDRTQLEAKHDFGARLGFVSPWRGTDFF